MDRPIYWTLEGHTPIPCWDNKEWWEWWSKAPNLRVAEDCVGDVWVSTVFLGRDHNCVGEGAAVLFETMCFSREVSEVDEFQLRYATWEEAEAGHRFVVDWVKTMLVARLPSAKD